MSFKNLFIILFFIPVIFSCTSGSGDQVKVVAHRGYWNCEDAGYARNSVAALRCAQEAGFWGSEFDVNMTSDGELIVFHDGSIDGKPINQTPYAEIAGYRLENGEKIPTLDDYLTQARRHPETVLVFEFKECQDKCTDSLMVVKSLSKIKEYGIDSPERIVFISFSMYICSMVADLMPGFTVQYLGYGKSPSEIYAEGVNGVDFHYSIFYNNPEWYDQARENGMSVNVWTVNEEEDMKKMIELGVDMLTTDNPDKACALIESYDK